MNSILAFIVSGSLIGMYIIGPDELDVPTTLSLYWILVVFAGVSSLNRAFLIETDRSTFDLLRLHGNPLSVYLGKLAYNILFTGLTSFLTAFLFALIAGFGNIHLGWFSGLILLGSIAMSGAATLLSALVSQTDRKATLFPALALPMLIPLMLILAAASRLLIDGGAWAELANDIMALIGYCGVTITASLLLFEYLWEA